ncbi:MAG: Na/Pi cotransporter family protein [Lachnospiraceae bacterium]|nr:Na/Pi cotransporter family protein [Lachnospiraceae bacterium]
MTLEEFFTLLGGVGLFLYGMTVMSSGLRNACGDNLQTILERATSNKIIAVLVGLLVTILVQSSSATDVMVIGFVNAGMMTLSQAIGVIMGANIGTTVTAQITAFNISAYAPLILFTGTVLFLFVRKSRIKYIGEFLMGFGMLFVGISIMKSTIAPLAQSRTFTTLLAGLDNPFLAILFGVAFTAFLQSSSSSTVIFQTFAMQGLLSYHTAVYLVIGAAIGSVAPNLIASLTTNRNGKRTALLNLIFNLIRAAILVLLIRLFPGILTFIQNLSPNSIGRQVANTHTIFATLAVLIELPIADKIIRVAERIIPILPEENEQLEDRSLQYMINIRSMPTGVALAQAHREVARMGRIAEKNLRKAIDCFFDYDERKAESVKAREDSVDILQKTINEAMSDLRTLDLDNDALKRISRLSFAVADMERLSDHAENIIEYAEEIHGKRIPLSDDAIEELKEMSADALSIVGQSIDIFTTEDYAALPGVDRLENRIDEEEARLVGNHVTRLMNTQCDPMGGIIFTNLVNDLERVGDHAVNIAYALTGREPEDKPTSHVA